MNKYEAYEMIVQSDGAEARELAERLKGKYTIEAVKAPAGGLVMMRARESVEYLQFNLGEVLVTTCELKLEGTPGYGMVMGMNDEHAEAAAILSALLDTDLPEKAEVYVLAEKLKIALYKRYKEEQEICASTRVNFETMGGQDMAVVNRMMNGNE